MTAAAADTDGYADIALAEAHVDAAVALSTEAGWNQTDEDWRFFLREAQTFGRLRRSDGALVGSATVLPLGERLCWIGMVLVTAAERRRGHATRLMRRAIDHAAASGAAAGLDATPEGRTVYRNLGFGDMAELVRMGRPGGDARPGPAAAALRRVSPADLPALSAYDAAAFGADRDAVLRDLHRRLPGCAFLAETSHGVSGFILARPGRKATQIGPLVANDRATANCLLAAALEAVSGPAIVDLFVHHTAFRADLEDAGFTEQRRFTRMLKDADTLPHRLERTALAAGPEIG